MGFWQKALKIGGVTALATGLTACAAIYTSPTVSDGSIFGDSGTDLQVNIIPLSFESTTKANLDTYVPARLPLGFQPESIAKVLDEQIAIPSQRALPTPPSQPRTRPSFIPDNPPPIVPARPYQIGIADVLLLSADAGVATLEQLPALISAQSKRQGFVVQDDGAIAIPDAGRVRVAGLTMQDAEAVIFQALVSAGIDPSFTFEISEFNSQRVSVAGEVRAPSLVPISLKPLFLHEAISAAGGSAAADARVAKIQLFRGGNTYQISLQRFLRDPSLRQTILQDGDAVYVTSEFNIEQAQAQFNELVQLRSAEADRIRFQFDALTAQLTNERVKLDRLAAERDLFESRLALGAVSRDYAYVTGEAVEQKRFELPFESKAVLADLLFTNRGLNINFADFGEIYVLRRSTNPEEAGLVHAFHLDATNAVNLTLAQMFQVHAGDVVFIAEQPVTAWNRALSQSLPTLLLSAANVATGL